MQAQGVMGLSRTLRHWKAWFWFRLHRFLMALAWAFYRVQKAALDRAETAVRGFRPAVPESDGGKPVVLTARLRLVEIGIGRSAFLGFKPGADEGQIVSRWPRVAVLLFDYTPWPDQPSWQEHGRHFCWVDSRFRVVVGTPIETPSGQELVQSLELGEEWEMMLRPLGTGDSDYRARRAASARDQG